MKKTIVLTILLLLTSCGKEEQQPPQIPLFTLLDVRNMVGAKYDTLVYEINNKTLDTMIEKKMSFPLFVYASGCGTCDNFTYVIKDYIEETHTIFPMIRLPLYVDSVHNPLSITDSALLFYENGTLTYYVDDPNEHYTTTKELTIEMEKHCYQTNIEYLSTSIILLPFLTPYNRYDFTSYLTEPIEETDNQIKMRYTNFIQEDVSVLLFDEKEIEDFTPIYQVLKDNPTITGLSAYGEEKEKHSDTIEKTLQTNELSKMMILTYQQGKLIEKTDL